MEPYGTCNNEIMAQKRVRVMAQERVRFMAQERVFRHFSRAGPSS